MRTLALVSALALACLAGCGGSDRRSPPPSLGEGARVFATSCTGCHSLDPVRGGRALPGGPLSGYRMTTAQLDSFVRTMPVPRPLSERERRAVVAFVAHAQRAHRSRK